MNGVCDTWCEGCEYLCMSVVCCDYSTIMGMRRGCPAGTGCDQRRRPRKWKKDERLKNLEKMMREEARKRAAEMSEKPPRQKSERGGRPRELRGASLDPAYIQRVREERIRRLMPILEAEQRSVITAWRKARGLSQRQAGELIGVSGSTISHWERGHEQARWELLEQHGCQRPKRWCGETPPPPSATADRTPTAVRWVPSREDAPFMEGAGCGTKGDKTECE